MVEYRFYDPTETIVATDLRIWEDGLIYEATGNISPTELKSKSTIPVFNSNWIKNNTNNYLNIVRDSRRNWHIDVDLSLDEVTIYLPNPDYFSKGDITVSVVSEGNSLVIRTHDGSTYINSTREKVNYGVLGDNITFHSNGIGWQIKSEVIEMSPLVYTVSQTTPTSFTGTLVDMNMNIELKNKGNIARLESGNIVFNVGGDYIVMLSVATDVTAGNNGSTCIANAQLNHELNGFIDVTRSRLYMTNRRAGDGYAQGSISFPIYVSENDELKLQIIRDTGSDSMETKIEGTSVTIFSPKGLRGETGEKGDIGNDGADGDITWENGWSARTYNANEAVEYQGSSFVCHSNGTSTSPGDPDAPNAGWDLLAKKGADGAGASLNVSENSSMIPNAPHGTLNFTGGVTVNDAGSGVADVNVHNGLQPYLINNDDIVLFYNTTSNCYLSGELFDNNMEVDLGPNVTINSIVATSNTSLTINYTTTSLLQSATPISLTRGGSDHFGQSLTCSVTDVIVGTGSAGTWTESFNAGEWSTPRWTVFEGPSLNNLFRTGVTTASSNTGATTAYDGDFLYTERSSPNNGTGVDFDAYAETTDFRDLTEVSFQLHKFSGNASHMGDLVIFSQNPNTTWTERYRHTGLEQSAQSDPFVLITLNATSWDCIGVRFFFENAGGWESDICLDDITITSV